MNTEITIPMSRPAGVTCPDCGADDWTQCDDSFDHAFGTEHIGPYLQCAQCNHIAPMPER